jgi:hypothetical protein
MAFQEDPDNPDFPEWPYEDDEDEPPPPAPAPSGGGGGGGSARDPWAGVDLGGASREWAEDFERRNTGDYSRVASAWNSKGGGADGDSGGGGGGGGRGNPYASYLGTPQGPSPQQDQLTALLATMQEEQRTAKAQRDRERASLMELLTGRMKAAQEPVSTQSPGIKELLAARQLQSQRGSERSRAAFAERMHAQGLGNSGAFDTGVLGIEQDRGESDSMATAEILGGELSAKRQELMQLLQMAASLGDSESTRTLQQQLAMLDAQIQQSSQAEGGRRFDEDLGFRKESFWENLGMQGSQFDALMNARAYDSIRR